MCADDPVRFRPEFASAPARLDCAGPPWTFAIGFARREPAAPPVQGMTSHPTGCRRGRIGRILRAARPPVAIQSVRNSRETYLRCGTGRDGSTPSRPCGQRSPPTAYLCEELGICNPCSLLPPIHDSLRPIAHQKYPPLSMISLIVSPWRTQLKMSTSFRSMPSARSSTS